MVSRTRSLERNVVTMDLMNTAREFVMGLPDGLQGLGVFLAGLVPFVEGEGAGLILSLIHI